MTFYIENKTRRGSAPVDRTQITYHGEYFPSSGTAPMSGISWVATSDTITYSAPAGYVIPDIVPDIIPAGTQLEFWFPPDNVPVLHLSIEASGTPGVDINEIYRYAIFKNNPIVGDLMSYVTFVDAQYADGWEPWVPQ